MLTAFMLAPWMASSCTNSGVSIWAAIIAGVLPQLAAMFGSAPVAVRCPLMASTCPPFMPAAANESAIQRRTPSGFGAVMLPPLR